MLDDVVEQLPTGDVLHDHEDVSGRGDHLVKLDNVGMSKQLQNLNLSVDFFSNVHFLYFFSVQYFYGHFMSC